MLKEAFQFTKKQSFLDGKQPVPLELFEMPEDKELREAGFPLSRSSLHLIPYHIATPFIETYEWLGNVGAGYTYGYGLYWGSRLGAVCVFAPTSTWQMSLLCGEEYKDKVIQLTRGAVAYWAPPNTSSHIIGLCLKHIEVNTKFRVVLAYADPRAGEIGTVYQATNWLHCGIASAGNDFVPEFADFESIHFHTRSLPKWLKSKTRIERRGWNVVKVPRAQKYRYVYLLGSRKERKELLKALRYPVLSYLKRETAELEVTYEEIPPVEEEEVISTGRQEIQIELVGNRYKFVL